MYIDVLHFIMENRAALFVFSVKQPNLRENRVKISHFVNFVLKIMKKMAQEKIYLLKPDFYNTDRKMKNINRRIFF